MSEYKIVIEDTANPDVIAAILEGLNQHAELNGFTYDSIPLSICLRNQAGTIVGGLHGDTVYGWLYISLFWVAKDLRGKGYGKQLIEIAEQTAIKRGCNNAYLNTFSFQALNFYQAIGYEIFGELKDFPAGQKRYFLQKINLKNYYLQING
jgi:GNAT superfamily N-acetyltransferase